MGIRDLAGRRLLCFVFAAIALMCVGLLLFAIGQALQHRRAETERLAELDKITLDQIVTEVRKLSDELGRVPKDEGELEALMGKQMPVTHYYTTPRQVHYVRRDEANYVMLSWTTSGIREYFSDRPEDGWVKMD